MAVNVFMPALEMAQETGKILAWLKREGELVKKGEPLLEVETDKAVVEIESPGDGILARIRARVGAVVPVGQTIAWLVQPGEAPPAEAPQNQSGRSIAASTAVEASKAPAAIPAATAKISPKARGLAREHGIDPAQLRGSGPSGEVLATDILSAAARMGATEASHASSSSRSGNESASAVARLMAERTAASWTTVPHFFVTRDADARDLLETHRKLRTDGDAARAKLTITDLLIALVARTLRKHPRLNSSWTGKGIEIHPEVNIGIAMAVGDGVVVVVIHKADAMSITEIGAARDKLSERAQLTKLQPADITGGTFTISNLGMYGVDSFTAIIVQPQAAILAVARIGDRVVAVEGGLVVRPMLTLTLSCDHRAVDGARAAEFMKDLAEAIADPQPWLR